MLWGEALRGTGSFWGWVGPGGTWGGPGCIGGAMGLVRRGTAELSIDFKEDPEGTGLLWGSPELRGWFGGDVGGLRLLWEDLSWGSFRVLARGASGKGPEVTRLRRVSVSRGELSSVSSSC